MIRDYTIIGLEWLVTIILLVRYIPKEKFREAQIAFYFKQLITWVLGLLVAQWKLIEYPVRLFPYANRTSFTFEYFVYPSICAIFNIHYPHDKSKFKQFMYYFYYCTIMSLIEVIVEQNTNILHYIHWEWYITWCTLFITFYMTRKYYVWYLRLNKDKIEL